MSKGNQPTDGGHLLMSKEERDEWLAKYPEFSDYIRPLLGAEEFINNKPRYCFWFPEYVPKGLAHNKDFQARLQGVREMREKSTDPKTRKMAEIPYQFREMRNPKTYILIPSVSSERRRYIPIGFLTQECIASNLCLIIPEATLYHFGILMSAMHMVWVNAVCGRLKGDYRYSKDIVYNNYPFPEGLSEKQCTDIEEKAQAILDVRASFEGQSLAELYDPITMPASLSKAHTALDKAVDMAYRRKPFASEPERLEHLFALYQRLTAQ